ncbi:hypothetical protein D0Z07_1672 [Hyphodiscus hymeniophilus]|uniref:Protein required for cell viability n=1 Tax=Hyphodiscus hymeniophilus TaxID=353542 RepID=A0A9P7AZP0_9HELO|nr:hypothetical protein D0Z07_1672 [Hyphodiscus hymeniophilus]
MDAQQEKKPSLADQVIHWGELGFDPELPQKDRALNQSKFYGLIERSSVLALMPVLSFLIQPGRVPSWLRHPLMSALALLPLRERGVQNAIEFILSVHPSNSQYEGSGSKKGSGISHEALNAASRLLSAPPSGVPKEKWFSQIAPQLFSLLEGEGEAEMDKAAAFIIGFGILGRKQYGAPGLPGWEAFVKPMLHGIDPSAFPTCDQSSTEESIVTLDSSNALVSSNEVARSLQRVTALLSSHPNPALTKRLLRPIVLPLWSLSSWQEDNEKIDVRYRKPARKLLRTFLQLSSGHSSEKPQSHPTSTNLSFIARNLTFTGQYYSAGFEWIYAPSGDGGIQIQKAGQNRKHLMPNLAKIDRVADCFIDLIKATPGLEAETSSLFMDLCIKWLKDGDKASSLLILTQVDSMESSDDIENRLIEAKILQKMISEIPEKLVSESQQVLDLVDQVLSQFNTMVANASEDTVAVALSLLNMILTSPTFQETFENQHILKHIQRSLELISKNTHLDISLTARNLVMLMRFRSAVEQTDTPSSVVQPDQQAEDRKSYNLAMSYLTATDSPPPVRVQGLELISNVVRANNPILDIPALLVLFSSLLQDPEEYIYLRAIKSLIQLSGRHPKAVMKDLIERYVDSHEEYGLDQRLRLGEALVQVIESSSPAFTGEVAGSVSQGLLSVAGRRGMRAKTEQAQEKQNRLKRKKDKEAEDAWDGEVPQLVELLEKESHEDYETISQIVSGWESKRGTEDVRIRSSAVSILAAAIESNVDGIGSSLISTIVDISIHILTLEPEPEKGILRRSAILLIMSFVRALNSASAEGKKLGFGFVGQSLDDVQRILKYVGETDNDGLVRRHASDVIESLQAWQMNAFLPSHNTQTGIQDLAGLSITSSDGPGSRIKPRIEEIE